MNNPIIEVIEENYSIPRLDATRKISALLPHDYYGQNLFNPQAPFGDWAIDKSMSRLSSEGFKDIIIIAIDHGERERIREYLPYRHPKFGFGKGQLYIEFMKERLIPYINSHYRTLNTYDQTFQRANAYRPLEKSKIYMYAGAQESTSHLPNVKRLESILTDKVHESAFFDIEVSVNEKGKHSELYWRQEFPKAIKWLFFNNKI
jgi:predicted alpha/beta superfamily hydrolase